MHNAQCTSKSKTDAKKRNVNHGAFGEITGTLKQMGSKQVPVNMKPVPKMKKRNQMGHDHYKRTTIASVVSIESKYSTTASENYDTDSWYSTCINPY